VPLRHRLLQRAQRRRRLARRQRLRCRQPSACTTPRLMHSPASHTVELALHTFWDLLGRSLLRPPARLAAQRAGAYGRGEQRRGRGLASGAAQRWAAAPGWRRPVRRTARAPREAGIPGARCWPAAPRARPRPARAPSPAGRAPRRPPVRRRLPLERARPSHGRCRPRVCATGGLRRGRSGLVAMPGTLKGAMTPRARNARARPRRSAQRGRGHAQAPRTRKLEGPTTFTREQRGG